MGRAVLATAMVLTSAGCYRPELERCAVACTDFCPADQTCAADGYCHAPGDTERCGAAQSTIHALTAGDHHACAIDKDDHLLCWGANDDAQVGVGTGSRRELIPTRIEGAADATWSTVDAGRVHTCGTQRGIHGDTLLCWGNDDSGQSGGAGAADIETPTSPQGSGEGWIAVAAGGRFSCGIRADSETVHQLYCWGDDANGQLGDGGAPDQPGRPEPQPADTAWTDWVEVTAGDEHACARRAGGQLYCWGNNDSGRIGDGTDGGNQLKPTPVAPPAGEGALSFRAVSAGGNNTCAINDHGKLYCWGSGSFKKLGVAAEDNALVPQRVGTDSDWSAVSVGGVAVCGVRTAGTRCWGENEWGTLGDGHWVARPSPGPVSGLAQPAPVAVGSRFACAAPPGGGVVCWGDNPEGELGNGKTSTAHEPTAIRLSDQPSDHLWTAVAAGSHHTCGIHAGQVFCWGWNSDGALDGGENDGTPTPPLTPITFGADDATAREIAVGVSSSCALLDDGVHTRPWCWGSEASGQLGNGLPEAESHRLVEIGTLGGMFGAAGAWSHLTVSGDTASALLGTTRMVWGDPTKFGLGNNNEVAVVTAPADAGGALAWKSIEQGYQFGCGIEQSNALHCWGSDDDEKQGDLVMGNGAPVPHVVMAGTEFNSLGVAWNGHHACAITVAKTLRCWGQNDHAQLGVVGAPINVPTVVGQLGDGWAAVAAGPSHTCGIHGDIDRKMYCWGSNQYGQLGNDQVVTEVRDPTRVGEDTGWTAISAGKEHTCGLRGGDLYCWGNSDHGQVGDGRQAENVPQPVNLPP